MKDQEKNGSKKKKEKKRGGVWCGVASRHQGRSPSKHSFTLSLCETARRPPGEKGEGLRKARV